MGNERATVPGCSGLITHTHGQRAESRYILYKVLVCIGGSLLLSTRKCIPDEMS